MYVCVTLCDFSYMVLSKLDVMGHPLALNLPMRASAAGQAVRRNLEGVHLE